MSASLGYPVGGSPGSAGLGTGGSLPSAVVIKSADSQHSTGNAGSDMKTTSGDTSAGGSVDGALPAGADDDGGYKKRKFRRANAASRPKGAPPAAAAPPPPPPPLIEPRPWRRSLSCAPC